MAWRQNIFTGTLFINRGPNGWSETYHLWEDNFADAAATFLEVCTARSYILAAGHSIVWALVWQHVSPPPAMAILTAPIDSLLKPDTTPYWLPSHDDFTGLHLTYETEEGLWNNRILHGVADDETTANEWLRRDLVIPAGPIAPPPVPNLATKEDLFIYALATIRDKTAHARQRPTGSTATTEWDVWPWWRVLYREVNKRDTGRAWKRVSWEAGDPLFCPDFTPCGQAVAVVRSTYEAPCVFYADGLPMVIRWYDAKPAAEVFTLPTIFWPYSQITQYDNDSEVGEATGKSNRSYTLGNCLGDAPGDHYTGTPDAFLGLAEIAWDPEDETPEELRPECDMPLTLAVRLQDLTKNFSNTFFLDFHQADGFDISQTAPNTVLVRFTAPPAPPPPPPITVDDDPGTDVVPNATRFSFVEADFEVMEVAPGWAKVGVKDKIDRRDFNAFRAPSTVGDFWHPPRFAGGWAGPGAARFWTNRVFACPFVPGSGGIVTKIQAVVYRLAPSGNMCRLGIYEAIDDSTPFPGQLLFDSGDLDLSTLNGNIANCSVPIYADKLYFLAMVTNWFDFNAFGAFYGWSEMSTVYGLKGPVLPGQDWNPNVSLSHAFGPLPTGVSPLAWAFNANDPSQYYTPALLVQFGSVLPPADPTLSPTLATTLEMSSTVTTYRPGVIELSLEMTAAVTTFTPPVAAMSPAIPLTLEFAATVSTLTPPTALMSPVIELRIDPGFEVATLPPPIHYWKFDAGAGVVEPDIGTAIAVDANMTNCGWAGVAGPPIAGGNPDSALFANPTDVISYLGNVFPAGNWTLTFILDWDGLATNCGLFYGYDNGSDLAVWLDSVVPGRVIVRSNDGSFSFPSTTTIATPQPTRVTVVYESGIIKIYFWAVLDATSGPTLGFTTASQYFTGNHLFFGALPGIFDDCRIYDCALNATQVARVSAGFV